MKNVQKVELRWADGSLSEVSKLRVRYEDCDPVDPNNPYASLGDSDVFQPANQGAPGIQGVKVSISESSSENISTLTLIPTEQSL